MTNHLCIKQNLNDVQIHAGALEGPKTLPGPRPERDERRGQPLHHRQLPLLREPAAAAGARVRRVALVRRPHLLGELVRAGLLGLGTDGRVRHVPVRLGRVHHVDDRVRDRAARDPRAQAASHAGAAARDPPVRVELDRRAHRRAARDDLVAREPRPQRGQRRFRGRLGPVVLGELVPAPVPGGSRSLPVLRRGRRRMVSYIFLWARALFLFRTYGQIGRCASTPRTCRGTTAARPSSSRPCAACSCTPSSSSPS